MDIRVIKPVPAGGVLNVPGQAVIYMQGGVAVIDYMAEVNLKAPGDPKVLEAAGKDALMVSAFDGTQMVYAKAPPADFVFVHHFAGTEVVGDKDAPVLDVSPVEVPLVAPVVLSPLGKV